MIVSTHEIEALLKDQFPDLKDWLPTDPEYVVVEPQEILPLIARLPKEHFIEKVWECEEFAMSAVVGIRRIQAESFDSLSDELKKYNQAIGWALGTMFQGEKEDHQVNIFIASDGVYFFDMQTRAIWKATDKDKIYFVVM